MYQTVLLLQARLEPPNAPLETRTEQSGTVRPCNAHVLPAVCGGGIARPWIHHDPNPGACRMSKYPEGGILLLIAGLVSIAVGILYLIIIGGGLK